jgi:hypothetical protein
MRKRGDNGLTYISNRGIYELSRFKKDVYDSADIAVHHALDSRLEWSASYTRSGTLSNAVTDINVDQTRIVRNNYGRMGWDVPDRFVSWHLPTPLKQWSVAYLVDLHEGLERCENISILEHTLLSKMLTVPSWLRSAVVLFVPQAPRSAERSKILT